MTNPDRERRALLAALGAVLLWSTVATAFKLALRHLDPVQLLLYACVTSLLLLGLVLTLRGQWHELRALSRGQLLRAAGLGVLNPFLYYLVLFAAYDRLPAQVAQPLNYTWALTLAYLSIPLLGQRLRVRDVVAGLVCYAGVVVIATGGNLRQWDFVDPLGVALALGSTLIWALYWIGNTRSELDLVLGLFLNFLCALPLIATVAALTSDLWPGTTAGLLGALYVGLVEMGLAFILWLLAMRLTSSTARVANLIFLSPFLSLLFISRILGESIRPTTYLGLILIVGGLLYQQRAGSSAPPTPTR